MRKRGVLIVVAAIAVFTAGFWLGSGKTAQGFGKGRVFELRTYTASEGKLAALEARFREHTVKIFERHGIQNVGYWVPVDAPASQNTLIYIVAFPDREAARKSWAEFREDPEWKKVQQESEANGKLVNKIESVFMDPTDFSPIQ